jgi:hypothetical protein
MNLFTGSFHINGNFLHESSIVHRPTAKYTHTVEGKGKGVIYSPISQTVQKTLPPLISEPTLTQSHLPGKNAAHFLQPLPCYSVSVHCLTMYPSLLGDQRQCLVINFAQGFYS